MGAMRLLAHTMTQWGVVMSDEGPIIYITTRADLTSSAEDPLVPSHVSDMGSFCGEQGQPWFLWCQGDHPMGGGSLSIADGESPDVRGATGW
jgi:hypothetical protein